VRYFVRYFDARLFRGYFTTAVKGANVLMLTLAPRMAQRMEHCRRPVASSPGAI
jgi:hypothetical protein